MAARAARVAAVALAAALAVRSAGAAPPAQPGVLPAPEDGFAQADAPRQFLFPRDHGPHRQFRQEWWYVTGNLDGAGGERFGFELTFFRFALAGEPGSAAPATPRSAWRAREIWMAHFAVTDVAQRRFRSAQKLSREALGLAGGRGDPAEIWIDDWTLRERGAAPSSWTLRAAQPGYALELTLESTGAPVLNGVQGLSRKASDPGAASYYYSLPRLTSRGRLLRGAQVLPVQGLAWLDREWGSGGLGARQSGWDWFGLQLADGSALMFYALRDRDGARDPYSAGTFIDPHGAAQPLASADVAIEVQDHWRDVRGDRYPSRWRVRIARLGLDLEVHPVLADQELATTPRYWEGAVDVRGTRSARPLEGRGYVELVGYAGALRQGP